MPQQINLCTPILLTQKRYFSAQTMGIALGVFVVLGAALCGAWVWNLSRATESFQQSLNNHTVELNSLKAAIQTSQNSAAPADPALVSLLAERQNAVLQREMLKEALNEGMFRPGYGHSDRLSWVAQSIPAAVWITEVRMDGARFEVSGFTLVPAALNDWVDKLSTSPLMQGLKLATVKVQNATAATLAVPGSAASATFTPTAPARPVWSFNLVSVQPLAIAPSATASTPGSKP